MKKILLINLICLGSLFLSGCAEGLFPEPIAVAEPLHYCVEVPSFVMQAANENGEGEILRDSMPLYGAIASLKVYSHVDNYHSIRPIQQFLNNWVKNEQELWESCITINRQLHEDVFQFAPTLNFEISIETRGSLQKYDLKVSDSNLISHIERFPHMYYNFSHEVSEEEMIDSKITHRLNLDEENSPVLFTYAAASHLLKNHSANLEEDAERGEFIYKTRTDNSIFDSEDLSISLTRDDSLDKYQIAKFTARKILATALGEPVTIDCSNSTYPNNNGLAASAHPSNLEEWTNSQMKYCYNNEAGFRDTEISTAASKPHLCAIREGFARFFAAQAWNDQSDFSSGLFPNDHIFDTENNNEPEQVSLHLSSDVYLNQNNQDDLEIALAINDQAALAVNGYHKNRCYGDSDTFGTALDWARLFWELTTEQPEKEILGDSYELSEIIKFLKRVPFQNERHLPQEDRGFRHAPHLDWRQTLQTFVSNANLIEENGGPVGLENKLFFLLDKHIACLEHDFAEGKIVLSECEANNDQEPDLVPVPHPANGHDEEDDQDPDAPHEEEEDEDENDEQMPNPPAEDEQNSCENWGQDQHGQCCLDDISIEDQIRIEAEEGIRFCEQEEGMPVDRREGEGNDDKPSPEFENTRQEFSKESEASRSFEKEYDKSFAKKHRSKEAKHNHTKTKEYNSFFFDSYRHYEAFSTEKMEHKKTISR